VAHSLLSADSFKVCRPVDNLSVLDYILSAVRCTGYFLEVFLNFFASTTFSCPIGTFSLSFFKYPDPLWEGNRVRRLRALYQRTSLAVNSEGMG